jgi:uncharacterized protein (DUF2236 family)
VTERPVSVAELEALLQELNSSLQTPRDCLFGPDSVSWKVNRESALFLGAGRAALLQLAHPWVAAAIAQHSRTLDDPVRRFHHTFRVIFTMMFGSADQAFTAARQLHRLHQQIRGTLPDNAGRFLQGTAYEANELAALTWVYATLVDSALVAYELLLPPLSETERDQYFLESLRMAALFGIPPNTLPDSWSTFREYVDSTVQSDALGVTDATRAFVQKLQKGTGFIVPPPFWYRALTIQLLPPRIREEFQLPFSTHEEKAVQRALRLMRRVYVKLPRAIRFVGPYNEAVNRLRGSKPGLGVRLSNRLWVGQPALLALPRN